MRANSMASRVTHTCRVAAAPGQLALGGLLAALCVGVQAQVEEAGDGRTLSVVPTLSISQTATDNSRVNTGRGQSDFITQVSPGLQVRKTAGRVQGALNYSLTGIVYARNSDENNFQNTLNAFATAEVVSDRAFIDVTGNVSRQLVSAFGTQLADNTQGNDNQADVATFSVSPYVRGSLSGLVEYEGRLSHTTSNADGTNVSDSTVSGASLQLSGGNPRRLVSWSATAGRQIYDFSEGRETESDTVRGVLTFAINPQFSVFAIGGRESNNFTDLEKEARNTHGFGFNWFPTDRTRFTAERERRFFGDSHSVLFEHRMRRSAIRFSSSRDVTTDAERFSSRSFGTTFDLFFLQFASIEPDPVRREQLVNNFLRANGISPTAVVVGGFLSSGVTLDRRQELSFTLLGVRDTVTFLASQSDSSRLDTVVQAEDDFSDSSFIEQRGFSVNWARRLTPISSLNLGLSQQKTTGSLDDQETELRSIALTWSSRLGPRTTVSLGARRSEFDSSTDPYDENAVTGSISMTF